MTYSVSRYRKEFLERTEALKATARSVSRKVELEADVRNLVFQAAIFQTSAAMEDYLKAMFDDWVHNAKKRSAPCDVIPIRVRSAYAARAISSPIYRYAADNNESELLKRFEREEILWKLLRGGEAIPPFLEGAHIYQDRKYPSPKNIQMLFFRIGVDKVFDEVARILKKDAEMSLISFNDIRTAIAHAQPPQLTYNDIEKNIRNVQDIVRALDRIAFKTLTQHLGHPAWTKETVNATPAPENAIGGLSLTCH